MLRESNLHPSLAAIGSVAYWLAYPFGASDAATTWAIRALITSLAIELGGRAESFVPNASPAPQPAR